MTAQPGCMQPYCSERPTLPLTDYKHNTSGDAFYFMQQYISLQNGLFTMFNGPCGAGWRVKGAALLGG